MKTSIGMILTITIAAATILVLQTEAIAADGDTLSIENGFGLPGSVNNPVSVVLENVTTIKGLYFTIDDIPNVLTISGANLTALTSNFRVEVVDEGETAKVLIIPVVIPALLIEPDSGAVLDLLIDVSEGANLGTTASLTISGEQVSDGFNSPVPVGMQNGSFWIGLKGDVDGSGEVDLFDVIRMIDIALQRPPDPSTFEMWAGDFDDDGEITVIDIGIAIDIALDNSLLLAKNAAKIHFESAEVVNLDLSSPRIISDNNFEVPVLIRSSSSIAGIQLSMRYDAKSYKVDVPKVAEMAANMTVATALKGNELRMIIYSLDGKNIPAGEGVLLTVPMQAIANQTYESMLILNTAIAASSGGHKLETVLNLDESDFQTLPETFALWPNSPNPFNSGTTITYEIPHTDIDEFSIQLMIYNIHGQLVRTLEDTKRSAGRYSLDWDGRDDFGQEVSTGVYFYKLCAGHIILTQKMALLR